MTSIATKKGDSGQTSLTGGVRVSKSSIRVDAYGTVDELNSSMGFARSICENENLRDRTKAIQQELFKVGSALATPPENRKGAPPLGPAMIDALTDQVHELEALRWHAFGLVDPRRASGGRGLRSCPDGLPSRGALCGSLDRSR